MKFWFSASELAARATGFEGRKFLVSGDFGHASLESCLNLFGLYAAVAKGRASCELRDADDQKNLTFTPGGSQRAPVRFGEAQVFTSGSTGKPKPVIVDVSSRFSEIRPGKPVHWFVAYRLSKWAFISVLLRVMASGGSVAGSVPLSAESVAGGLRSYQSEGISLTPTMARLISLRDPASLRGVERITLGGEYAPQRLLDDLRCLAPAARIVHVFSSTETGDLCSVSDAKEGYPAETMEEAGVTLSTSGEMFVNGVSTGDLWSSSGDRLVWKGRSDSISIVGGENVDRNRIAEVIRRIDNVLDVRVWETPSPISGAVIKAHYIGGPPPAELRRMLLTDLRKVEVPGQLRRVEFFQTTSTGKADDGN